VALNSYKIDRARLQANWLQKLQAALKRFLNRTLSTLMSIYVFTCIYAFKGF